MVVIEVPFAYGCECVPPKARSARKITVLDTVPISFREMDDAAFPVAARFTGTYKHEPRDCIDLRWDGTFFYLEAPGCAVDGGIQAAVRNWHNREQPFTKFQGIPRQDRADPDTFRLEDLKVRGGPGDREERIAALIGVGGDLVSCEGAVWTRCPMPCWRVVDTDSMVATLLTDDVASGSAHSLYSPATVDALRDYRATLGYPIEYTNGAIEVLIPEAFARAEPEAVGLRHACKHVLVWMRQRAADFNREHFDSYATFRDGIEAQADRPDMDALHALALDLASSTVPFHSDTRAPLIREGERYAAARSAGSMMPEPSTLRPR